MKYLVAAAALAGSLTVAGAASATVIYSENFSGYQPLTIAHNAHDATSLSGNTLHSDYNYRVPNGQNQNGQLDSMYDEGTWTIGTNPNAVHNLWIDTPLNTDPFLMLNGSPVSAGTYNYSYDLLNLCCKSGPGTPSFLQLWYFANGSSTPIDISTAVQTSAASNGWDHASGSFTVGDGFIQLGLSDNSTIRSGNDFGVDNIRLGVGSVPEPATWGLMIMGFGGLGAMLRRRRAAFA
jgi:PEP-CTERM motif